MRLFLLIFLFNQSLFVFAQPQNENAKPFVLGYID